ncbi:MAG TPA: protein kinase [Polyangiaceae bacterium]|jgi:serine/threonine protein kinase|nr:protein kinase [Polyangiaceae bacterium]
MPNLASIQFRGTARFELCSLLGRGASGVVYEALDRERGAPVALKVLAERHAQAIASFKQEFRALQEIRHPNLVDLKELIFDQGHWLLSMQLVRGVDIVSYVWGESVRVREQGPSLPLAVSADDDTLRAGDRRVPHEHAAARRPHILDEARLRPAFEQLACGLSALHQRGKIHRDIKRSNVLVDAHGHVTILDFGLIAELDALGTVEQGELAGTPAMMAPEQAALRRVGPASDWYSFGAVLYQALTGRAPFIGSPREILENKLKYRPEPPARVAGGVPHDLSELCTDLLALDPSRRPSAEEVLRRLKARVSHAHDRRSAVPAGSDGIFVGRANELAILHEAFTRTLRGEAVTVLIEGESGLGKTSLVREFLRAVRTEEQAVAVFTGRCFERESLPYKALDGVMDAVHAELCRFSPEETEQLLPPDTSEIARAFPVMQRLQGAPSSANQHSSLEPHAQRERVFGALRALFVRLAAHRPSIVVIDDLQWTDIDSLAALSALLQPPKAPAMLWLLLRRPTPLRIPLLGATTHIPLGPLSHEESNALVTELVGASVAAHEGVFERVSEARGHPLFLREIARQIATTPEHASAPGLDAALWQRVNSLTPDTRRLLELTAVAGGPIAQGVLADAVLLHGRDPPNTHSGEISRLAVAALFDQVGELRHAGLVCTAGARLSDVIEVYHDRIRETVVARLNPRARRQNHLLLASALERSNEEDAEALAHHWQEAGDRTRAHRYAVVAADEAASALAFERAARLYRSALDLGAPEPQQDLELRRRLGDALANAGRGFDAAQAYQLAAKHTDSLDSVALERLAAEQLLRSGHIEQGISAVSSVLQRLGIATPKTRLSAVVSLTLLRLRIRLRDFRYRPRSESEVTALTLARLDGAWMAATCLTMFDGIRSAELQCRTTLLALQAGTPLQVLRAHTSEAIFLALAGRALRPRIERSLHAASSLAAEFGHSPARAWVALSRGASAFFLGEWSESEEQCATAEAIFQGRPGASFELASARAFKVWAAMMRGRFAAVLDQVPSYVADAERRGDLYAATYQMTSFSNVAWLSRDDVGEARRMLSIAESRWPSKHFDVPRYSNMMAAAHIELYEGRGRAGHERILRDWAPLRWGVAFRAQITRFGMRFVRGLAALAAYDERPTRALLRDAESCARAIAAERVTWGECFASILFFGTAARNGDAPRALCSLLQAETKATATGMMLHRAVVRYRRGELLGGEEGRTLIDDALSFMRNEQIKNPLRMLDMLSPRVASSGARSARQDGWLT